MGIVSSFASIRAKESKKGEQSIFTRLSLPASAVEAERHHHYIRRCFISIWPSFSTVHAHIQFLSVFTNITPISTTNHFLYLLHRHQTNIIISNGHGNGVPGKAPKETTIYHTLYRSREISAIFAIHLRTLSRFITFRTFLYITFLIGLSIVRFPYLQLCNFARSYFYGGPIGSLFHTRILGAGRERPRGQGV